MNCLRLSFLAVGLLAVACGPEKGADTDDTATTAQSPDTTGGDPGSTGTTVTTTAAPTTGGPACVDPGITDIGPAVTVTLRNNGAARVFVNLDANCTAILPLELRDAADAVVKINRDACEPECEVALAGGCGCPAGCGPSEAVQIDPGGSFVATWTGRVWTEFELPAECPADGCLPACFAAAQAPAGNYTLSARAHDTLANCDQCTCSPGPEGSCILNGFAMGGDVVAEGELVYPENAGIDLVFE